MKKHFFGMLAAVCSGTVWAADFVDTAKVISSTPIYERVSEPKQECWIETISSTGVVTKSAPVEERSVGGALLGGLIGGVVGSQIGQGNGSTVATGAGAIAGAIIGDRVANKDRDAQQQVQTTQQVPQTREESHCRQVENYREVIRGYDVTYRYNGKDISTRLPYQPGNTVKVSVGVVGDASDDSASDRDRHDARDVRDYRDNRKYRKKDRRYDD